MEAAIKPLVRKLLWPTIESPLIAENPCSLDYATFLSKAKNSVHDIYLLPRTEIFSQKDPRRGCFDFTPPERFQLHNTAHSSSLERSLLLVARDWSEFPCHRHIILGGGGVPPPRSHQRLSRSGFKLKTALYISCFIFANFIIFHRHGLCVLFQTVTPISKHFQQSIAKLTTSLPFLVDSPSTISMPLDNFIRGNRRLGDLRSNFRRNLR
jgi:hypothetical protein